jgi:hypothetical protein
VAQLGSGNNSGYPYVIDTRQTFVNAPAAAPDSATRLDAELANDSLHAIVQLQSTLGTNPQGNFGSLAARLQQFLPGGGESPLFFGFTSTTLVAIPGAAHRLATASPLFQVYDANIPRAILEPASFTVDTLTYDIAVGFATEQSGAITLAAPSPQYTTSFTVTTPPYTVTIPGAQHLLGSADLLVRVYTTVGTDHVLATAAVTVHPGTFDVVVSFVSPTTGSLVLSNAAPRYRTSFTQQTSVTVPGAAHAMPTPALLAQVYDNGVPRAIIRPNTLTVDPNSFDVHLTFVTPQSGHLVLVQASVLTGNEFEIRDAGVPDSSAVRVRSEDGSLVLQTGSSSAGTGLKVENHTGALIAAVDPQGNLAITGGTATKPGGGPWASTSDLRVKTAIAPFEDGLEQVLQLQPISYEYNGLGGLRPTGRRHTGFLAQEVEPIAPYLVGRTQAKLRSRDPEPTELLTFEGEAMIPLLVNTIKALHAELARVHERLLALEAFHTHVEPEIQS